MSKPKNNRAQTNGKSSSALSPEVLPPEAAPTAVKTVSGHRLREEKERFVIDAPVEESGNNGAQLSGENEFGEEREECPHCEGSFRVSVFEENDGFCPGCGLDEDGLKREAELPELSEAEMLLQSIANDDEYSLRVDRLTNYENDGHTDSRAARSFCTTLKPVTLDYLDVVRRSFGGGAYYFSMYKKGRAGFVKTWCEVIAKPLQPIDPVPAGTATVNPPIEAPRKGGLEDVKESLAVVKEVWSLMAPSRQRQELTPPEPPPDPLKSIQETLSLANNLRISLGLPELTAAPAVAGGSERSWVTDISTLLASTGIGEGIKQLAAPIGSVVGQLIAAKIVAAQQQPGEIAQAVTEETAPPTNAATNQPAANFPAPAIPLLTAIVTQLTSALPVEESVQMTLTFVQSAERIPGARDQVVNFLDKSILTKLPYHVALWLAQGNPDWKYILDLPHCFAWIESYQELLREQLLPATVEEPAASEASADEVAEILTSAMSEEDSPAEL